MSDTMRKRVARALMLSARKGNVLVPHWHDLTDVQRSAMYDQADAAIEAIRVPTEAMGEAAYEAVSLDDRWSIEDLIDWNKSFTAAIDAALAEPREVER